jgi:single-strand DNA-binding protein
MAGSVNKVIILGVLGKDPESRSFANGGGVVNLSVATSESWKDKQSGERKEKTEWHRVGIFNDVLGEIVQKYAKKGDKIYIEGQIQTRKWVDNAGNDQYSTEIIVKGFQGVVNLIGRTERRDGQSGNGNARTASKREPESDYGPRGVSPDLDDEIPF